jgi:hypothetical protein
MAGRGRPPRIAEHYDTIELEGGGRRDRTIAHAIADFIRLGNYMETACHFAGIHVSTVKLWLREGDKAQGRLDAGARRRDLTTYQRRCADFLSAVRTAQAEAEQRDVLRLAQLARGGIPVTTTTERWEVDQDGQERLVERSSVTRETLPDVRAITWRLERRFPDRWQRRTETEEDLAAEEDDEFGEDPIETALRRLDDRARRLTEGTAALEQAGLADIVDAEIVDERLPEDE